MHSIAAYRNVDWHPGRVYFLMLLEPPRDGRTLALTARSASHLTIAQQIQEAYAKLSLKKYRPIAARNEDAKVSIGLL
jgi:hypothetical protein